MYEADDVEGIRLQAYRDLYNELGQVVLDNVEEARPSAWEEMDDFERFVASDDRFYTQMEQYMTKLERWDDLYERPGGYADSVGEHLPRGTETTYWDGTVVESSWGEMPFEAYLRRYTDEIQQAESPIELKELIEEDNDHWSGRLSDEYPSWYEGLWETLDSGEPTLRHVVGWRADVERELSDIAWELRSEVEGRIEDELVEEEDDILSRIRQYIAR